MLLFLCGGASSSSPATPCVLTCFLSTNKRLRGAVLMAAAELSHLTRMGRSSLFLLWREGTLQVPDGAELYPYPTQKAPKCKYGKALQN